MVCHNLLHAHLQDIDLMQIPTNMSFKQLYIHVNSWNNLWMRIKGPHNYMVTALGLYVKWP